MLIELARTHRGAVLVLLLVVITAVVMRTADIPMSLAGNVESAAASEPFTYVEGERYHLQIEQFRRYGSLRGQIESDPSRIVHPELSVRDITFQVSDDGLGKDVVVTVSPPDEDAWYSWSSPDGVAYTVTNHRSGESRETRRPTESLSQLTYRSTPWFETLTNQGWSLVSLSPEEAVFEIEDEIPSYQQDALSAADRELSPVRIRHEIHLNPETDVIQENYRYLIDAEGNSTVVEYFKILEIGNVSQ
jgi:hypothetical protein